VEAAICAAEKARMTVRTRSVAALFIITFLLACAGIPVVVELSTEGVIIHRELARGLGPPMSSLLVSGY
jgi:hypothetical protein